MDFCPATIRGNVAAPRAVAVQVRPSAAPHRLDTLPGAIYGARAFARLRANRRGERGCVPRVWRRRSMTDDKRPSDLDDLGAKLRAALARHGDKPGRAKSTSDKGGLSIAFRIGVELVAALAIGVGIGWALDRWLGSSPWLLILFFVFGAAAGVMNV